MSVCLPHLPIHPSPPPDTHTHKHILARTHTHTRAHTLTHTAHRLRTRARMHTHTQTHTDTQIYTHSRTHTHIYSHTHSLTLHTSAFFSCRLTLGAAIVTAVGAHALAAEHVFTRGTNCVISHYIRLSNRQHSTNPDIFLALSQWKSSLRPGKWLALVARANNDDVTIERWLFT